MNRSKVTKLLLVEGFLSEATLALFDATSIVAMFLSTLGASAWQIGLVAAVSLVGGRVPQIFVATRFHGRLRGLLVKFASFQWLATVFMALSPGVAHFIGPGPALACFMLGWSCFSFGEGASFVPWSEAVASTVGRRCGRFLGAYGLVESLGTMFAGMIVYIFARTGAMGNSPGYLGVFGTGSIVLMVTVPLLRRVEDYEDSFRLSARPKLGLPPRPAVPFAIERGREGGAGHGNPGIARPRIPGRANAFRVFARKMAMPGGRFRTFVGAQFLSMGIYLISPFIFLYGCNKLALTARASSLVVWAEMAGISLGSVLAGRLASRSGSGAVVKLSCVASAAVPILAVLSGILPSMKLGLFAVMGSMLCLGVFYASSWVGCTGYVVESTRETERPMIVAMLNLLALPFMCLSPLGGLAIKQTGYVPVFGAALVSCLASAVLAFQMD